MRVIVPHADRDPRELNAAEFAEHRHAHEVNMCLAAGEEWTKAHCARICARTQEKGRPRAERIWRECKAIWREERERAIERMEKVRAEADKQPSLV